MAALGIIPARFGSSRFPGKPLALILGKSLIQHTYENATLCQDLEKVVVATDDQRIYDHVLKFGGEVVMTSKAHPTGTDRLQEVVTNYNQYSDYELIVNVQGDEPCVNPGAISALIELLRADETAAMATPVTRLVDAHEAQNSSVVKCVKDRDNNALYFSRALIPSGHSGEFNPQLNYYRHLGLYVYRRWFLLKYASLPNSPLQEAENLEQLKVLENGYRIKVAEVDGVTPDVNHPEDIKKVEQYLCKLNSSS